jgi:hypothetical protein
MRDLYIMIKNLPEIKIDLNITKTNLIYAMYGLIIGAIITSGVIYSSTKNSYYKILNTKIGMMTIVHDRVYTLEEIRKAD